MVCWVAHSTVFITSVAHQLTLLKPELATEIRQQFSEAVSISRWYNYQLFLEGLTHTQVCTNWLNSLTPSLSTPSLSLSVCPTSLSLFLSLSLSLTHSLFLSLSLSLLLSPGMYKHSTDIQQFQGPLTAHSVMTSLRGLNRSHPVAQEHREPWTESWKSFSSLGEERVTACCYIQKKR